MEDIGKHWGATLQALTYWIAYKKQYYYNSLMPEGAIVAELTQLLSANVLTGLFILDCERMYKRIASEIKDDTRADIVLGSRSLTIPKSLIANIKKNKNIDNNTKEYFLKDQDEAHLNLKSKDITEVVEVKRYEAGYANIIEDIEKLHRLKEYTPLVRRYLIVASQSILPSEIFTAEHNVRKTNIYNGVQKIIAMPRLGKKAYATKKKSEFGAFSVLIEVL